MSRARRLRFRGRPRSVASILLVRATLLVSALSTAAPAPGEQPPASADVVDAEPTAEPDVPAEPELDAQPEPLPQPEPAPLPEPSPQPAPAATPKVVQPPAKARALSGFAEFDTQLGRLDGVFTTILGGSAALVLRDRFIFGGSGYGMVYLDRDYPSRNGQRALELAYGGALLGIYTARTPRISSAFNLMLGGGRACLRFTQNDRSCDSSADIFVSQLELAVYLKLSAFARLGFAFGYRFIGAAQHWKGPGNWDLAGGYGALKLAFGRF
jgi:hypothetical protein